MKKNKINKSPAVMVEGPEPEQDLSYKWVLRNDKI